MTIFFLFFGLLLLLLVTIICIVRKIIKRKIGYINWSLIIVAIVTIVVSFIEIPVKNYSEAVYNKNRTVSTKTVVNKGKTLNLYSLENGQSIVIQYNNKNILIDVPSVLSQSNDKNNIFNVFATHDIKKIDMLILTSSAYKSANNILDVVGRYNIDNIQYADESIEKTNLDKEILEGVKAVNDVKKSSMLPKVMEEKQNLFDMEVENEKTEEGNTLTFKLPKNIKGCANLDSYDKNIHGNNIYDHKIKISYDSSGYISLKIISDISDKD
ncbi:hypothetical protein KYB31_10965 [Clostridium felsineum]|uniref:hypothetical protein n=1 Tax=Clostridium felsineum TaxID=36839 RepID=UPI00214DC5DB|nr:hypothetical protein [Clostridium felsineum]MCR3759502.1 hypothetical protein [Clostridium felsineum]